MSCRNSLFARRNSLIVFHQAVSISPASASHRYTRLSTPAQPHLRCKIGSFTPMPIQSPYILPFLFIDSAVCSYAYRKQNRKIRIYGQNLVDYEKKRIFAAFRGMRGSVGAPHSV